MFCVLYDPTSKMWKLTTAEGETTTPEEVVLTIQGIIAMKELPPVLEQCVVLPMSPQLDMTEAPHHVGQLYVPGHICDRRCSSRD